MLELKKISLFLVIAIILMQMPVFSFAAVTFDGGTGTAEDPYLISTKAQLEGITDLAASYKLTANIGTSNDPVTNPIGRTMDGDNAIDTAFVGNFDGNNKTVYINISGKSSGVIESIYGATRDTHTHRGALFTKVSGNATIKNLTIEGTASSQFNAAGLIACIENTDDYTVNIENVTNNALVQPWFNGGAGIVAYISGGKFNIKNCVNNGRIGIGGGTTMLYSGGIVGYTASTTSVGKIEYCTNNGEIYEYNTADSTGADYEYIGGIIGYQNRKVGALFCVNSGNITSKGTRVGGISGILQWQGANNISNCINNGNITGEKFVGGLVGDNAPGAKVFASYNTGNVTATISGGYAGGISGRSAGLSTSLINSCYNTGLITATYAAGIVASNNGAAYSQCYNANEKVPNTYNGEAEPAVDTSNYFLSSTSDDECALTLDELRLAAESLGNKYEDPSPTADKPYNLPQLTGTKNNSQIALYKVTASASQGGNVDKTLEYVWRNDEISIKITPESGYLISSIKLNGQDAQMPIDELQAYDFTIDDVTKDETLTVTFDSYRVNSETTSFNQFFATNDDVTINGEIITGPKVIAFATSLGAYKHNRIEFGMYFSENIADLELPTRDFSRAKKAVVPSQKITSGGKYAIMFYGSGMNSQTTYYALPYAIWDNNTTSAEDDYTVFGDIIVMTTPAQ